MEEVLDRCGSAYEIATKLIQMKEQRIINQAMYMIGRDIYLTMKGGTIMKEKLYAIGYWFADIASNLNSLMNIDHEMYIEGKHQLKESQELLSILDVSVVITEDTEGRYDIVSVIKGRSHTEVKVR